MELTLAELPQRERYKLLIVSEEPPLCIIGTNRRQTDGGKKHTLTTSCPRTRASSSMPG